MTEKELREIAVSNKWLQNKDDICFATPDGNVFQGGDGLNLALLHAQRANQAVYKLTKTECEPVALPYLPQIVIAPVITDEEKAAAVEESLEKAKEDKVVKPEELTGRTKKK